jgi:membrane associated rhomboid family serine protease
MHPSPLVDGPLTRDAAMALLRQADELLESGDFRMAAGVFQRVIGFDDRAITGAAMLGLGEALYRLDQEDAAVSTWESILQLPENPSTYQAWRNIAAARVREGDLRRAMTAYREADRRAPPDDKAEIANRLGWLSKETGNQGAAGRYFARGRGTAPTLSASNIVLAVTIAVSLFALYGGGSTVFNLLELDKTAVAQGEYWRLLTVTLLHASLIHLGFNMYALYLAGPVVEGMYGSRVFALFYLLTAAAASTSSFVFGGAAPSVGASGAIFGLFGVLISGTRIHHPVLDRRARAIVPQLGMVVVINLAFGFLAAGTIDNAAHIGGLISGLWLGYLIPPGQVRTLGTMWQPAATGAPTTQGPSGLLHAAGIAALVLVIAVGLVIGTDSRQRTTVGATDSGATLVALAYLSAAFFRGRWRTEPPRAWGSGSHPVVPGSSQEAC